MELILKKLKRGGMWNITFSFVCLFFSISGLLCLLNYNLPDLSVESSSLRGSRMFNPVKLEEVQFGKLGEMMIGMLPDKLPFTVFVPSEDAFQRVLKLRVNDSLVEDTFAIISRLIGFSAVPQLLPSVAVPVRKEISFDSVSGYSLYAWKNSDGTLVVNNIPSECIDIRKGEIIIHIMGGVIMDAEFEQSFHPDYED